MEISTIGTRMPDLCSSQSTLMLLRNREWAATVAQKLRPHDFATQIGRNESKSATETDREPSVLAR